MALLERACRRGDVTVVKFLLHAGVPADECSLSACMSGDVETLQLLHDANAIPLTREMLAVACSNQHVEVAEYLVGHAKAVPTDIGEARQLLTTAAAHPNVRLMKLVVDACCKRSVLSVETMAMPVANSLINQVLQNLERSDYANVESVFEAVEYLIELGGALPKNFCKQSTDQTNEMQKSLLLGLMERQVENDDENVIACWKKMSLTELPPSCLFLSPGVIRFDLTEMDLSHNLLSTLPSALFDGSVRSLSVLNASHNSLFEIAQCTKESAICSR